MTMETILTRDQRTTSHRVLDRVVQSCASALTSTSLQQTKYQDDVSRRYIDTTNAITARNNAQRHLLCHSYLMPAFYDDRGARSGCNAFVSATTWLWLACLVLSLLVMSVHSAPVTTHEDKRLTVAPKWVNPCGLAAEDFDGDLDVVQLQDDQLLQQIVVQAKTALMHAKLFRDGYIGKTFNLDIKELLATWKNTHYNWLPSLDEIPKQLGEELDQEYLDKLELDKALLDAYRYMQLYAVGLEQIVWDQEDHHLEFRTKFKDTEFKLRTVLCEIQVALVERGVEQQSDITRNAMPPEYRTIPAATYRDLRDWLIFRDYMNGLEYVVQVFEHLHRRLQS